MRRASSFHEQVADQERRLARPVLEEIEAGGRVLVSTCSCARVGVGGRVGSDRQTAAKSSDPTPGPCLEPRESPGGSSRRKQQKTKIHGGYGGLWSVLWCG